MDELYQQHASGAADHDAARGRADASLVAMLHTDGGARQSAIAQLYRRYGRDFKAYFRRHGAAEALAEDVLQETFVKVLRSIGSWNGAGTLEAWLWTVARNTLMSALRHGPGANVSIDDLDGSTLEAFPHGHSAEGDPADADCVKRGLVAFAEKHTEAANILERVAVDGWGYEELAQFRGCTAGAAREYLSQCRKRIWSYIGHCYQSGVA